jgi:Holliday junction resolvase RusA-like endonuclease|tara:strand:+ start:324 stop:776 length:453 start_codon:yes stop_codon:yes gene_type:complete
MIIEFKVHANPKPWVIYVRHTARSERHKYMEAWQGKVAKAAITAYDGHDVLKGESVRIDTHFFLEPSKSAPKRKYDEWRSKRIAEAGRGNPDLDNLRKSTIDGLEGVIIDNDCMVVEGYMTKQYIRDKDSAPYAHIFIFTGEDLNGTPRD